MIHLECDQGSPEWLLARAGAITASRFAEATERVGSLTEQQAAYVAALRSRKTEAEAMAIAGYKKRPTFEALERALAGEPTDKPSAASDHYRSLIVCERIAQEPLDDTFVSWQMRRGIELEPVARQRYEARTGNSVYGAGIMFTDDRKFGYSTDGVVEGQGGGVEIKVPAAHEKVLAAWLDPQPLIEEYLHQINGGLWITGWRWIDLVIYTPWLASIGKDLFIHRVHRDDNAIEALESNLLGFLRRVDALEAQLRKPSLAVPPWVDGTVQAIKTITAPKAGNPFVRAA